MTYSYILVGLLHSALRPLAEGNLAHASLLHVLGKLLHHSEDSEVIHDLPSIRNRFIHVVGIGDTRRDTEARWYTSTPQARSKLVVFD